MTPPAGYTPTKIDATGGVTLNLLPNEQYAMIDYVASGTAAGNLRVYTVQEVICNLATTAQNMLEPLVDILPGGMGGYKKQWIVTSGYRLKGVLPQESPTSSHCKGFALDIALITPDRNNKTYEIIQKIEKLIPYDQLILEYRDPNQCWIHMGYAAKGLRRQVFTMVNDKTYQGTYPKGGFVLVNNIPPPVKKT